ncbi:hypothetical protein PHMEG_0005005 [Phytophthora megakarya]|uniref:Uncharacterized protein n=1 Tax=Phytophthora megakarya TaxID=4795 RepID=A0A225WSB7_9STRA|nr:hypothetical protein PHMEG_0005005 [Phytophthora megakarya]
MMDDASYVQFNALERVFGGDNIFIYLICEKMKTMSEAAKVHAFQDIYNTNFSRSMEQCTEFVRVNVAAWCDSPESTNNPVEQFNKKIKGDYTLRQRLKM